MEACCSELLLPFLDRQHIDMLLSLNKAPHAGRKGPCELMQNQEACWRHCCADIAEGCCQVLGPAETVACHHNIEGAIQGRGWRLSDVPCLQYKC